MEATKENIDKAYEAVEIAKKTGKLKKGVNEVTKVVEREVAKLVLVAKDVNPPEVVMHLKPLCQEKNIPILEVNSKDDLGSAAGIERSTAAVAIINEGDAKKLIQELLKEKPKKEDKK